MSIAVDLIIIAIIALFTFIGYRQGLIKVAIKIFSFFVAIIIAFALYKPVSNLIINNTTVETNIQNAITEKILPDGVNENEEVILEDNKIPSIIIEGSKNTVKSIAETVSIKIIEISSLLIIFIITKIILKFVTILADLIGKIPVIKQFNKLGGTLYGLVKGFLIVFIILGIISFAAPIMQVEIITLIDNSILGGILYNNNLLLNIIF